MKLRLLWFNSAALLALAVAAHAQSSSAPDSLAATPAPASASTTDPNAPSRMYYGGSIGFSFWSDYTRISVEPLVGRKLSPKLSVGGKLRYEYLSDKRGLVDYTSHNFGASVLSNYRLLPMLYAHAEAALMSYDYPNGNETVPFLLVGGGYVKPMRGNMAAYVEVLWDLLNDSNSPYEEWQPVVSVGVSVGF